MPEASLPLSPSENRLYTYPLTKTGTSQDLMTIVARACERRIAREGHELPAKSGLERAVFEAPFNAVGMALRLAVALLPADLSVAFHDWLFRRLAAPRGYAFDASSPELARARTLAAELESESRKAPALVALISHPPVYGELAHMNFELVRQAVLALRQARGRPCRPRLVVAVDFFALDTVSVPVEGLYAGFMGLYHLGLDRLAVGRAWLSRIFVGETHWHRLMHRLLRRLRAGGEVGLVLSGGVPQTTRVLYAAREWAAALRRRAPRRASPNEVLSALRAHEGYRRFEDDGQIVLKSTWRRLEAWAMAAVAGAGEGTSSAEHGQLQPEARGVLLSCAEALGFGSAEAASAVDELAGELARETPYRPRFFRVLAARLLRCRDVVFVPVRHTMEPLGVRLGEAWAWKAGRGTLEALRADGRRWRGSPEDFARLFVEENFA